MIAVLVALFIIAIPVALATRTVLRLTRVLGAVDGATLAEALEGDGDHDLDALSKTLAREAPGSVAQLLVDAVVSRNAPEDTKQDRTLALAEAVADVERGVGDDARVPRVAASLATTGGLLAAALVMRDGLGREVPEGADPVVVFQAVIERGLSIAAIAVLGGIICASLHRAAQQQRRARLNELDALAGPLAAHIEGRTQPAEADLG